MGSACIGTFFCPSGAEVDALKEILQRVRIAHEEEGREFF